MRLEGRSPESVSVNDKQPSAGGGAWHSRHRLSRRRRQRPPLNLFKLQMRPLSLRTNYKLRNKQCSCRRLLDAEDWWSEGCASRSKRRQRIERSLAPLLTEPERYTRVNIDAEINRFRVNTSQSVRTYHATSLESNRTPFLKVFYRRTMSKTNNIIQ